MPSLLLGSVALAALSAGLGAGLLGMALGKPEPKPDAVVDAEIVRRFCAGDRDAFSELVLRYQDRVYAQCLRWMGDPHAAEDVAQEVFLAIYRSLDKFRGESLVSTWIFRITVNHCKNRRLYRARRKHEAHEPLEGRFQEEDGPTRQIPAEGPGTDRAVHRSEAEAILYEALESLEEGQRDIVLLRDIQDLSYEEIADILELPRGTVKSRLHRARAELARILSRLIHSADIFD